MKEYKSTIIEKLKTDGYYKDFVDTIAACSFMGKDWDYIATQLADIYPTYCGKVTEKTIKKWIKTYPEIASAFALSREMALGRLVIMGMDKAKKSIDNPRDDFIVKLMDRLDDGTINPKNAVVNKENQQVNNMSGTSVNTLNRILVEASRFGGLDNIEIDDSDIEEDEESEGIAGEGEM